MPIHTFSSAGEAVRATGGRSQRALMLGTALGCSLAIAAVAAPERALALDECGAAVGGVATCDSTGNPYPTGIDYVGAAGTDLTVIVEADVVVNATGDGLTVNTSAGGDATADVATGATITSDADAIDVRAYGADADVYVYNGADLTAASDGVVAFAADDIVVDNSGDITAGGAGIIAYSSAYAGDAAVNNTGDITVDGTWGYGDVAIWVRGDNAGVTSNGTLDVYNADGDAWGILSAGATSSTVLAEGAINVEALDSAYGVLATSDVLTGDTQVNVVGVITAVGGDYAYGISASGAVTDVYATANITATADNAAIGIDVYAGDGDASVTLDGDIAAQGGNAAVGINIETDDGSVTADVTGDIDATSVGGFFATGIDVYAVGNADVNMTGDISAIGAAFTTGMDVEAFGYAYIDLYGDVTVSTGGLLAIGIDAAAILGTTVVVEGDISSTSAGAAGGIVATSFGNTVVAVTGDITADGDGAAYGIYAYGALAAVGLTGSITATSDAGQAFGIDIDGATLALVDVVGDITVDAAANAYGIYIDAAYISVEVEGNVLATSDVNAFGIDLNASDDLELEVTGDVTADAADTATAIDVVSSSGYALVDIEGDITATAGTGYAIGLEVYAGEFALVAVYGDTTVNAAGEATGIYVNAPFDYATVDVIGNVSATSTGSDAYGLDIDAYFDTTLTMSGDIAVSAGADGVGADLDSDQGSVSFELTGDLSVAAYGAADGVLATATGLGSEASVLINGDITAVSTGPLPATTSDGVRVSSNGDGIATVNGDISVTSNAGHANGVNVFTNNGGATVAVSGDVTVTAERNATGLGAFSSVVGDASVTLVGNLDVTAGSTAIGASAYATDGDAFVDITGDVSAISSGVIAAGLLLESDYGYASATLYGDLTAISTAVAFGVRGYGDAGLVIDITGDVTVMGDYYAYGMLARSNDGDTTVTLDGDLDVSGAGRVIGIRASSGSDTVVAVTGDLSVSSSGSYVYGIDIDAAGDATVTMTGDIGAYAYNSAKGIEIDTGPLGDASVTLTGDITANSSDYDAFGMAIYGDYSATVTMTGNIDARAYGDALFGAGSAYGMLVESDYGGIDIDFSGGLLASSANYDAYGIDAFAAGDVSITTAGDMSISAADFAAGIYAESTAGDVAVEVTGNIYSSGGTSAYGVYVQAFSAGGDGSVTITGNVIANSPGILAYAVDINATGDATMVLDGYAYAGGALFNTGLDIDSGTGFASTTVTGDITVNAPAGYAIGVSSYGGLGVLIDVEGDVDVYGYESATGFDAYTFAGTVNASLVGSITAESANTAYGIEAIAGDDVYVDVAGDITAIGGVNGEAIHVEAGDFSAIFIDSGEIYGSDVAIHATTLIGTYLSTAGTIWSGTGLAIDIDGGEAAIYNSGEIYGFVDLTANDDYLYNSGLWETYGTSDFGGLGLDADIVVNTGEIGFSRNTGAPEITTLLDLEYLDNYGVISGVDGQVDDYLYLPATAFFGGAGSELHLDVELGGPGSTADVLVVGTAAGSTEIVPNDVLAASPGVLNFGGILVVETGGTSASAFTMDNVDKGFVEYELILDGDDWFIVGLPDNEAFELLVAAEGASEFWRRSADAVTARWQEIRDASGAGGSMSAGPGDGYGRVDGWELWMQAHGGDEGFDSVQVFDIGGFTFVENLGHDSDWRGFQFGVDNLSGNFLYGFTMGFVQQETELEFSGNSFDFEGWNIGGYVGWASNGFFMNALLKGDFYEVDGNFRTVPTFFSFDGTTWGLQGELGYRFGRASGWFLEPVAQLQWSSTDLDSFTTAGASVDFGDNDSLLGKAGLRVGGTMGSGDVVLTPYIGLFAVEEFEGEHDMTFATGPTGFGIQNTPVDGYGQVEFGATAQTFYGLEGFLKGTWNFGDDADGGSARLGVRWRW